MKKLICIFMVFVMFCVSCPFVTTAETIQKSVQSEDLYREEFEKYLLDRLEGFPMNGKWCIYNDSYYHYYSPQNSGNTPDWVLVFGTYYGVMPSGCYGVFGEYCIVQDTYYVPYSLGYYIYVPSENRFYTLEEAWVADMDGVEKAFTEVLLPMGIASFIGDADADGSLTVMDATHVQRYLGGLCVFDSRDDLRSLKKATNTVGLSYISDIDCDGERTILDATTIQMKLAKV